jgi:VWFA-related protein
VASCAALFGKVVRSEASQDPQASVFHAYADGVFVEAAVLNGATPVPGLVVGDFQVFDNGVRQQLDEVSVDSLAIDLSLLVDVSSSVRPDVAQFAREATSLAGALRTVDRVRVATFDTDVTLKMSLRPSSAATSLAIGSPAGGGSTCMYDAIFWALSRPTPFDRRHLVVLLTDGLDSSSALGPAALLEIANRAEGTLHAVVWRNDLLDVPAGSLREGTYGSLTAVARATGGDTHFVLARTVNLLNEFVRVLATFRQSYILRYRPNNVKREGWHALTVTVPEQKKVVVRARKGYFVE